MTEELLKLCLDKFDEKDTDKTGAIKIAQFKTLFPEIMGGNSSDETAEMYFRGIDANNSGVVTRQEFTKFVTATLNKDEDYMIKLAFRSFDKDQSQNLNCAEVKAIAKYVGREMTDDEVEAAMEKFTGSKKGSLNYAQVYKMITGKDLDSKIIAQLARATQNANGKTTDNNYDNNSNNNKTNATNNSNAAATVSSNRSAAAANPQSSNQSTPDAPEDTKKKSSCCLLI